jgi:hypothetical protein
MFEGDQNDLPKASASWSPITFDPCSADLTLSTAILSKYLANLWHKSRQGGGFSQRLGFHILF